LFAAAIVGAATFVTAAAAFAAFAATEHLHLFGDDLGGVVFLAFLVGPLARLQAPFDIDRASLFQVLAGDLGEPVEERDPVPFGLFDLVARVLGFPGAAGGDADVADGVAVRCIAHLGIAAEVADEDHFVDR